MPDHPFFALRDNLSMYLLYLDDSGAVQDSGQEYFVLGGLAVFERQSHWIGQHLDTIAARFDQNDSFSVELHGSPMLNGSGIWRRFPLPVRIAAMKECLQMFATSHSSNRAFAVAVRKRAVAPRDPVEVAFEQLCSRFDQFLMRCHRNGQSERGIIVFDKSTQETNIQRLAIEFRRVGHSFGQVRNLAEVPMFLDSRASRLVQLADLIAYSVFRYVERGDGQFFDIISKRFDRDGSTVHGFRVIDQQPAEPAA